jgi:hypothetical protein
MDKKLPQNPLRIIGSLLDTTSHQRAASCSRTLLEALTSAYAAWPPVITVANCHCLVMLGKSHRYMANHLVRELDVSDGKCLLPEPLTEDEALRLDVSDGKSQLRCKCDLGRRLAFMAIRSPNIVKLAFRHSNDLLHSYALTALALLPESTSMRTLEVYAEGKLDDSFQGVSKLNGPWQFCLYGSCLNGWSLAQAAVSLKTTAGRIVWPPRLSDVTEHLDIDMRGSHMTPGYSGFGTSLKTITMWNCPFQRSNLKIFDYLRSLSDFRKLDSATVKFSEPPPLLLVDFLSEIHRLCRLHKPTYALHVQLTMPPETPQFKEMLHLFVTFENSFRSPGGGSITLNGNAARINIKKVKPEMTYTFEPYDWGRPHLDVRGIFE